MLSPTASKCPSGRSRRAGFSLAEVAIATAVAGLVGLGLTQFSWSTSRLLFDSTAKVDLSADVRLFTSELSRSGRSARSFYIYPNFSSEQVATNRQTDGGSGDFLVFVWIQPGLDNGQPDYNETYYARLVGYGRSAADDGYGPLERYERTFPMTAAYRTDAISVENLVKDTFPSAAQPPRRLMDAVRGLAGSGRLFTNFRGSSVILNGQILHGNEARSVTHLYNFTVSPRG